MNLSSKLKVNIFSFLFIISFGINLVLSVVNNLHTWDGVSPGEIIAGDVFFEVVDPPEISFTYRLRPAKDFGHPWNASFQQRLIPLVPVDPSDGCGWPKNADQITDSVALVQRGECTFVSKAIRAEQVGARAIIITDFDNDNEDLYIEMGDDNSERDPDIPAAFLVGKNGYIIRNTLERLQRSHALIKIPVNVSYVDIHRLRQPPWLIL